MTSQIALFNSLGVAVASDTVITHSSSSGAQKTTNNANKIWTLGDEHLVAVLLSGNMSKNGINARLLVTEWAKTLGAPFATLREYPESFRAWLCTQDGDLITSEAQRNLVNYVLNDHFYGIKNYVDFWAKRAVNAGSEPDMKALMRQWTQAGAEHLASLELYEYSTDAADAEYLNGLGINVVEKIDFIFDEYDGLDDVRGALIAQAGTALSRAQSMPCDSLFGFVGFGSGEYFAQAFRFETRGFYNKSVRYVIDEGFGVGVDDDGALSTFAQADAIHGFLSGAEWDMFWAIQEFVSNAIDERVESSEGEKTVGAEVAQALEEYFKDFRFKTYVSPMLTAIEGLSLKGLADLAESLVGIQAMRSASGEGPAGVGGFIEALVIDRADGIHWVKRLSR